MNRLKGYLSDSNAVAFSSPRVISILSGKGGVGKSVTALNLAERAAAAGGKTLLVDADICCGNLHILANVDPNGGLDKYARDVLSLANAVTCVNENLDLLARSDNGPSEQFLQAMEVARFVARLRLDAACYDLVIIDHSSGISDTATVFAGASDVNLLVLVPELTSISDCYGLCKYLYQADPATDCRLVVNRIESESEAEFVWTKFAAMAEQFLGRVPRLAGNLPEDTAIRRSVASQRPVFEISPEAPVVQAIAGLVRTLVGRSLGITADKPTTKINSETAYAEIRE